MRAIANEGSSGEAGGLARRFAAALLAIGLLLLAAAPNLQADEAAAEEVALEQRIAELVEKLGAGPFFIRERAQQELLEIGLPAFDALFAAQQHPDVEVALRARYLIRKLRISWALDTDPPHVRRLLVNYDELSREERESRVRQLAALVAAEGAAPLCRIVRFEKSEELSKRAALLVLGMTPPDEAAPRGEFASVLRRQMSVSRRPSARWIRLYSATLVDPDATLAEWGKLIEEEQALFATQSEKTSREILRDLVRFHVALLDRIDRSAEAVAAMRHTIELLDGTRKDLLDSIDWLLDREAWPVVDELAKKFEDKFNADPTLLYRLAESRLKQQQMEAAEETAGKAHALIIARIENPGGEVGEASPANHVLIGYELQERGLFPWAIREYQRAIDVGPEGSQHDLRARFFLSELHHDQQRSAEAAKVLTRAIELIDADEQLAGVVEQRLGRSVAGVRSRMHFFHAVALAEKGEFDKVRERLDRAAEADPSDADALIARYRLPDPPAAWHARTRKLIREAAEKFHSNALLYEQQIGQLDDEQASYLQQALAIELNQYAWLVGNTEGDYDAAIAASHRSLELKPETAGYLDTLGRCYYAKQDYENAVRYQRQAVKLDPHGGQIRRQLELFEKALAEKKPAASGAEE